MCKIKEKYTGCRNLMQRKTAAANNFFGRKFLERCLHLPSSSQPGATQRLNDWGGRALESRAYGDAQSVYDVFTECYS
jgi:hypothetical protein